MLKTSARYFKSVVTNGSMRAASRALAINQSAISRQLHQLEGELNVRLIERHRSGIKLTEEGERLMEYLRDVDFRTDQLLAELHEIHGLTGGHVRIHAVETMLHHIVPRIVEQLLRGHPGISFEVMFKSSEQIHSALMSGEADIGLAFASADLPQIRKICEFPEHIVAIMRPDHPLAIRQQLTMAEVARWPLAVPAHPTRSRMLLDLACKSGGLELKPALQTNSVALMHRFAECKDHISVTNRLNIDAHSLSATTICRPLLDVQLQAGNFEILVLEGRKLPAAAGKVLEAVMGELPHLSEHQH